MQFNQLRVLSLGVVLAAAGAASAQTFISYSGGTYSENFDSLPSSGTPTWSNSFPTIQGWSVFRSGSGSVSNTRDNTATANATLAVGDGTSNGGNLYSFGSAGTGERALGTVASGTPGDFLYVLAITNNTGQTLQKFTLGWDLEQWRQGGQTSGSPAVGTQHSLNFDYKVNNVSGLVAGDTSASTVAGFNAPGGAFDGTGPVGTAANTGNAVDGNSTGLQSGRGGMVTGLNWANGTTLVMRWWDDNNTGNDHGLAIDNVTFTAAVPEPGTMAALGLGLVAFARKRRNK